MPRILDRRAFLRRVAGAPQPQRPPWSVQEHDFAALCNGCGACIRSCPEAILVAGTGNLPLIDFSRGGCTFCGRCVEVCAPGALAEGPPAPAWTLRARISATCLEPQGITCRVCETACEAAALRFRPRPGGRAQVTVSEHSCTGCGGCVAVCPAAAITMATRDDRTDAEEAAA